MSIQAVSALASVCLAISACGGHSKRPVPAAEWKAVINDWYDNGRFDHPHSCAAVRAAERRLPVLPYSDAPATFRRYEAKRC
jgi:hypothetical protein